jgi:Spy/CpxP family protein refolding chaperone
VYRKIISYLSVAVVASLIFITSQVYADEGKGCGFGQKSSKSSHDQHADFSKTFFYKAMFAIKMQDELGLSEEQVKKIKGLKVKTKKELIQQKAEIDIIEVDINSEIWEDIVDIKTVDKLVDKKYDLKKAKAKTSIKAYAALKSILTGEQNKQLAELCKKGTRGKRSH